MAEVTLTAAMRANLYSLQGTAQLMGTIQNRLSTGKKVNSALDNPNNFFQAQALTNRASDLSALLDGMGQAIQALTTASQGITSAQKIVDQMKSVANTAAQSITTASNANGTNVVAYTTLGTKAASTTTAVASTGAATNLLTDLGSSATVSLGIVAGDTLTLGTNTFTVGAAKSVIAGNGGGTTLADLKTWALANGATGVSFAAGGNIKTKGATTVTVGGTLKTALGLAANLATASASGSVTLFSHAAPTSGVALAAGSAYQYNLTNLIGQDASSRAIENGDQMTVQVGTGATYTFTVGASSVNNSTVGNGGGSTAADLATWLNTVTSAAIGYTATTGQITVAAIGAGVTISGNLATELGMSASSATSSLVSSSGLYGSNYTGQSAATGSTLLSNLTDANGKVLYQVGATTGGTGNGSYLTLQVGGGASKSINITATSTVQDLLDGINSITGLSATVNSQGSLKIVNNNSTAVTVGGTADGLVGATSIAANSSASNSIYEGYGKVVAANVPTTLLTNLQPPSGQSRLASGDQLKLTIGGVTTTISVAATGNTSTSVSTVKGLMDALGQISGVSATLDSVTGQLDIRSSNNQTITFSGTAAGKLSLPASVAAGQSSASAGGVSAANVSQYDALRSQLDQLVQDASYKGINLLSGAGNNPLTVVFNEKAVNTNKIVINAVDLTTSGLGLTAATSNWKDTASIQSSLTQLTSASATLREDSATFGQNLTTVQTRQDFTNNMISTLKSGADNLTLADMNEESANMLALQTRQQLGIQSLSLASQANQAVMRLFG